MPKGWTTIRTDNNFISKKDRYENEKAQAKKSRHFNDVLNSKKSQTLQELKDEGKELAAVAQASQAFMMEGYKNKKLKSASLIREAQKIEKGKEKQKDASNN